ncbi:MAG: hypothetical protein ABWU16_01080 [Halothiobacillaceae bacterium]
MKKSLFFVACLSMAGLAEADKALEREAPQSASEYEAEESANRLRGKAALKQSMDGLFPHFPNLGK